uniref:Uncharacterized protein n=1 Tax=Mycena chlorophos TaxID=658473 RepID=A0ABQ0LT45_MYCCL|nr:predicted protein [Mycena chlorophos]
MAAPSQNRPRAVPLQQLQAQRDAAVAEVQNLRTWNTTLQTCLDVQKLTCEDLKEQLSAKDAAYSKLAAEHEHLASLAKVVSDAMYVVQKENNTLHHADPALAVADATHLRSALEKETQDHKVTKEERDEARRATRKLRRENIQLRASIDRGEDVRSLGLRVPSEEV